MARYRGVGHNAKITKISETLIEEMDEILAGLPKAA